GPPCTVKSAWKSPARPSLPSATRPGAGCLKMPDRTVRPPIWRVPSRAMLTETRRGRSCIALNTPRGAAWLRGCLSERRQKAEGRRQSAAGGLRYDAPALEEDLNAASSRDRVRRGSRGRGVGCPGKARGARTPAREARLARGTAARRQALRRVRPVRLGREEGPAPPRHRAVRRGVSLRLGA